MNKKTGIQLTNALEPVIDVVRDSTGMISSGLVVGDILYQNQYMILTAQKGEFKEYPTLGVGINDLVNDDDLNAWKKTIREEFAKDNLKIDKLSITTSGMELKAYY